MANKEAFNWRCHLVVTLTIFIAAMLLMISLGSCRNQPDEPVPAPRTVVYDEPKAMPMPPLPPMNVVKVSLPSSPSPQPPQPTTIPPPLDADLQSYQVDVEPEDNTTERSGCENGACDTGGRGGWYLGRRFGRRR